MNKVKLLFENFVVYGLGGAINKIIPLIMLPIITRLMPNTSYYGISDLANTIFQFGSAFAIMGMYDATFRLFFEKDDINYKKSICSTALFFTLLSSIVVFLLMIIFNKYLSTLFFNTPEYANLIYITATSILVGSTNNILMIPTRTQNKRRVYLGMNILSSILSYGITIPLLLNGYYILALPLSQLLSAIVIEFLFFVINKSWFNYKLVDFNNLKSLLIISVPLLPNFLIYWIFNSCDRIMISKLLGTSYNGIFSVSSKLSNVSQLIYLAFAGGWAYFAFNTMKEKEQVRLNSRIFEFLGIISFSSGMLMCTFSYFIMNLLFTKDYTSGYIVSAYLFLSPLIQMLFQVASSQFLIIKKTWPNMFLLSLGAIINVVFNYYLIPLIGIEGAAIATLLGYIISVLICVIVLHKINLMKLSKNFIICTLLTIGFYVSWRIFFSQKIVFSIIIVLINIIIFLYLYKNEIELIKKSLVHK